MKPPAQVKDAKPEVKAVEPVKPAPRLPRRSAPARRRHKKHTLEMRANQPTWVKVSIDDKEPFEMFLRKRARRVEAAEVFLRIGNAAGGEVTFDGKGLRRSRSRGAVYSG